MKRPQTVNKLHPLHEVVFSLFFLLGFLFVVRYLLAVTGIVRMQQMFHPMIVWDILLLTIYYCWSELTSESYFLKKKKQQLGESSYKAFMTQTYEASFYAGSDKLIVDDRKEWLVYMLYKTSYRLTIGGVIGIIVYAISK